MSNLLARVTGGSRGPTRATKAVEGEPLSAPAISAPTMKPPRFGNVAPEERLPQSKPEEELLDIPAFLRRQAN